MICGNDTVLGKPLQRPEATTAGIDCKTCLRQRMNHQVLFDARLANTGEEFGVVARASGNFADVERARLQLVERDHPDVGSAVRRGRSGGFGLFRAGGFQAGRGLGHSQAPRHAGPGRDTLYPFKPGTRASLSLALHIATVHCSAGSGFSWMSV